MLQENKKIHNCTGSLSAFSQKSRLHRFHHNLWDLGRHNTTISVSVCAGKHCVFNNYTGLCTEICGILMVTAPRSDSVPQKNLLFRQSRLCKSVQLKNTEKPLQFGVLRGILCTERCCRRTVASRDMADYSVKLGRVLDGVIFFLKNYFLFLRSRMEMTIEMMAQIAVMRAKSAAYVTMRITSRSGRQLSAAGGSTSTRKAS